MTQGTSRAMCAGATRRGRVVGLQEVRIAGPRGKTVRVVGRRGAGLPSLWWPDLGWGAEALLPLLHALPRQGGAVWAVDPPGHGGSEDLETVDGADVVAVWHSLLEFVGRPAVVGGHALGAVAALMGLPWVETRVAGVVLLDGGAEERPRAETPLDRRQCVRDWHAAHRWPDWNAFWEAMGARGPLDEAARAALRTWVQERHGRVEPRLSPTLAAQYLEWQATYRLDALWPWPGPALLVHAGTASPAGVAALARAMPRLRVVAVPEAGHELLQWAPGVAALVTAFLGSLGGRGNADPAW